MRSMRDIFRSCAVFDAEGRHTNGTDKESNHHYGDAYEQLFMNTEAREIQITEQRSERMWVPITRREDIRLMMEVGVADGACLLAWREIFPNATVVGMDIHPSDRAYGDCLEFHLGDQRSREDCERAAAGRQFDLIVEDATHHLPNTLLTLFWLWPFVRPGGLYVVEEWDGVDGGQERIRALWPGVEIVGTCGPHIADEPLVVFRKPLP